MTSEVAMTFVSVSVQSCNDVRVEVFEITKLRNSNVELERGGYVKKKPVLSGFNPVTTCV